MSAVTYPPVVDNGATHTLVRDGSTRFYTRTAGGNEGRDLAVRSVFRGAEDWAWAMKQYATRYPKMMEQFR